MIEKHVRRSDIVKVARLYPTEFEPVRKLAKALTILIDLQAGGDSTPSLDGTELYEALGIALADEETTLQNLLGGLRSLPRSLPSGLWASQSQRRGRRSLRGQPRNFPPFLIPVLIAELTNYLNGKLFNPSIHLVDEGNRDPLQIRWRRQIIEEYDDSHQEQGGILVRPHFMVLDASADTRILNTILEGVAQRNTPQTPEWPCNVHVHQWAESTVSK